MVAQLAESVFDGDDGAAEVDVGIDGFHSRCVELEHAEHGVDAVVGCQEAEVVFAVGHRAAFAGDGMDAFALLMEVSSADGPEGVLEMFFFRALWFVGCA